MRDKALDSDIGLTIQSIIINTANRTKDQSILTHYAVHKTIDFSKYEKYVKLN